MLLRTGVYTEGSGEEPGDDCWDTGGTLDCTTSGVQADPHPGHTLFRRVPFIFRGNFLPLGDLGAVYECSVCVFVCVYVHTYILTYIHIHVLIYTYTYAHI